MAGMKGRSSKESSMYFIGLDIGTGTFSVVARDPGEHLRYPTDILTAEEVGAFGAALLAGVGIGAWATTDAACEAQSI